MGNKIKYILPHRPDPEEASGHQDPALQGQLRAVRHLSAGEAGRGRELDED